MKKSISFFLLIGMTLLNSCETQETVLTEQNNTISNYNTAIVNFFTDYKASLSNNKENTKKISALMQAIDYGSIKQYDLKTTEKLLVIDLKEFNFTQNATNNKLILFVNNNKIARARLVNFESQDAFNQYDDLIVSILNMDKTKLNYTGRINQFNVIQIKEYSNVFSNGTLIENGALKSKVSNSTLSRGDCTDWWWVTTYSDGSQTASYAFTSCDTCDMFDRSACAGGGTSGTGGGGGGDTYSKPSFPDNPVDTQEYNITDSDGVFTKYKYNKETNNWDVVYNILSDVVVRRNPQKYSVFIVIWPKQGQKVVFNGLIYTYDASGTGNWEGELATNEVIAKTIEDQIDDSQLDPCTKGVLDKLKNLSGGDITNMLKRFTPPGSIFIINMKTGQVSNQNDWAQTTPINGSRTDINMVFNENYINGTNNSSRPTDLSVATTMAHEVIHAYLISLLEENKACGASGICDFPTVFDAYVQQQITKDPSITVNSHHELIANNYVNTIAATIQEFHTGQSVNNPSQEYLDLAWGGLTGTQIFNEKYPNDTNDKNYNERVRIFARINTEKLGTQYGINSPIGTPCKK